MEQPSREHVFEKQPGLEHGTLSVRSGASSLALRSRALGGALACARLSDASCDMRQEGDTLLLEYSWWSWLRHKGGTHIDLADDVTFRIDVRGGVTNVDADLRSTRISGIEIKGGVSGMVLALPPPAFNVPIVIHGGVVRLFVLHPYGTPVRLDVRGGATGVVATGLRAGSLGGPFTYRAPDDDGSTPGYEITIRGGACSLVLERGEARAQA